jgi:membrane protein YdbS with pleckstrin-like domain
LELQEVVDAQQSQNHPLDHPDLLPGLVVEQPGRRELDSPATAEELTASGSEDVLEPVGVRAIGQCKDIAATRAREDVHRGVVLPAGSAAAMDHDAHPRKPTAQRPGDLVQRDPVDLTHPMGNRHDPTLLRDHPGVWHDAGMGISKKLLFDGEYVVLSVRSHGKALILPVVVVVVVVGGIISALMMKPNNTVVASGAAVVGVPLLIVLSLIPFLRWMTSTYTVTNRRLITRQGILSRSGRDIPLFRINDVAYEKGLLDRLLGCGTLIISDATEKAGVVLPDIPHVEQVQLQISELLFTNDDGNDDDGSRVPGEPPRNNR